MKNKIVLFSLLAFITSVAEAACNRPVNPNRVVLLLDTNFAKSEYDAAEKAACERGEGFVAIPGGYGKKVSPAFVKIVMNDFAKRNVAISSLIVSGHDGGGYTMGPNGYIKKEDLINIMKQSYASKPFLLKQLHTVLMWGCYSATPDEVLDWKTMLPDLKVVGGFFGSAPASANPIDASILHDLLVKSDHLSSITDSNRLRSALMGVTKFGQTTASLYVRPDCEPDGVLYSQTGAGNKFSRLKDALQCTAAERKKLEFYSSVVQRYFSGNEDIPGWTDKGPLRDAYSYARQLEHCLQDGEFFLNPDRVGHLLFWDGIRQNFMENFRKEMQAGQDAYNSLSMTNPRTPNQKNFAELLKAAKSSIGKTDIVNLYNLKRDQIALNLSRLSPLLNHPALREDRDLAAKVAPLRQAWKLANAYLYRLEPKCMDFLPWHEHHNGRAPQARCH